MGDGLLYEQLAGELSRLICEKHGLGEPWAGYRGYLNQRLMELMRAYGDDGESRRNSSVAVTA